MSDPPHDDLRAAGAESAVELGRANQLNRLGRWPEALASAERALSLNPALAQAANARGNALVGLGRSQEAERSYRRAIVLAPNYDEPHANLGTVLMARGDATGALEGYEHAIRLSPQLGTAWVGCGNALSAMSRWPEACVAYARAARVAPDHPYLAGQRLHAQMKICDWTSFDERVAEVRDAVARGIPTDVFPLYGAPISAAEQKTCAEHYAATRFGSGAPSQPPAPGEKIRLGYFSADFHSHATAYLIAELIELHDRTRFEVIGFSFGPSGPDPMRDRLRAGFDRFFDLAGLDDAGIAEISRGVGIDLAIDLKGYTIGSRPGVFAARAAPVQVSYLGFPGTLGARFMDYILADPVVIPNTARGEYIEKVARVGGCYQPNDRKRPQPPKRTRREDHGLPTEGFVLACFNSTYKITPDVFTVWMRLLTSVKGSVLWLMDDNPTAVANLRRAATEREVDPRRLVFAARVAPEAHLERHQHIDLFLDTFHYTAHTTASDALWMDTPIVTRLGKTFAARVAASLVASAGLPELVCETAEAYEDLALRLAHDPERLAALRVRLAAGKVESRLFDTPRLAREIEQLYAAMHEGRLAHLPPEHLDAG